MSFVTITSYLLSALFLFFLAKAVWKVLPHYWPAFGKFKFNLRTWRINFGIRIYKLFGYEEFQFKKGRYNVKVMANSQKEAYTKFKKYTKTNRKHGISNL